MTGWLPWILAAAAVIAVLRLAARATIGARAEATNRPRSMRWRIRLHLRPGAGFASMTELVVRWSRLRAVAQGGRARPGLPLWARLSSPVTMYAVVLGRAQLRKRVFGRMEDQRLLLAPPRVGKTGYLAGQILDHPGPVLATTTRADLWSITAAARWKRGPVHVFNPQGVGGVLSTFSWDIVGGCEDPATAARRAGSLTGAVRRASGDLSFWQSKSANALAALLHAAALGRRSVIDVYAWCNRTGDSEAEKILATDPRSSRALLSTLAEILSPGKTADSIRVTMSEALSWVAIPAIASATTPDEGRGFDVREFVTRCGTLYMIAADAGESPIAPLFRAFAEHVHYEAGLLGSVQRAGRLDPPLLLALDEVAQVCPVPLPEWLSDSAGKGIMITAVAHGMGQLETRWGKDGAATIWSTAGVKILLGGISDSDTLEFVSRLCGDIELRTGAGASRVRVLPPELLRALPDWRALIVRLNLSPVVVKIRPAWKRRGLAPSLPAGRIWGPLPIRTGVRSPRRPDTAVIEHTDGPAPGPVANGHRPDGRPPTWARSGSDE